MTKVFTTSKAYFGADLSGKMISDFVHQTKILEHAIKIMVSIYMYCMPSCMFPTNSVEAEIAA